MNWKEFITSIQKGDVDGIRYSDYTLSAKTSVDRSALYKVRKGGTTIPRGDTVQAIEKAFDIRINDSDPNNITYTKNQNGIFAKESGVAYLSTGTNDFSLKGGRLASFVDSISGIKDMNNNIIAYQIQGTEETDLYTVGDEILIDKTTSPKTNDRVVLLLNNDKVKIFKCIIDSNFVALIKKNSVDIDYEKIEVSNIKNIYRIYAELKVY